LQIQDDGHGIKKEDFPLLCERFATSKIQTFGDLRKVRSFGFRGEALASISLVSKVTVTSKVRGADIAYIGDFTDGLLIDEDGSGPKPIAAQEGTTI
jgi:DNA mismatch repair protein MLH1